MSAAGEIEVAFNPEPVPEPSEPQAPKRPRGRPKRKAAAPVKPAVRSPSSEQLPSTVFSRVRDAVEEIEDRLPDADPVPGFDTPTGGMGSPLRIPPAEPHSQASNGVPQIPRAPPLQPHVHFAAPSTPVDQQVADAIKKALVEAQLRGVGYGFVAGVCVAYLGYMLLCAPGEAAGASAGKPVTWTELTEILEAAK